MKCSELRADIDGLKGDGCVLIGGHNGVFYSGSLGGSGSIDGLKKYLPEVIKKGRVDG